MNAKEIRTEICKTLGETLIFNKEFDIYIEKIKESIQKDILLWCNECSNNIQKPNTTSNRKYKEILVFFKKIGNNIRITLIKKKNENFIEIYLTNHRDYDKLREELGFKKSSYYYS